jgi:hypothetical protein
MDEIRYSSPLVISTEMGVVQNDGLAGFFLILDAKIVYESGIIIILLKEKWMAKC